MSEPWTPSSQRPTWASVLPFLAVAVLGLISMLLPPYDGNPVAALAAGVLLAGTLAVQLVSLDRSRRTWIDPVGAWLFYGVIALLREGAGGASSGVLVLLILPVLWLALFGVRRDLYVAAGLAVAVLMVPILVIGGPRYPVSDWRKALLWMAITLLVAPVVQRVVGMLAVETQRHRESSAQLRGLFDSATLSSLIATDVHGTITIFGTGAERLLGYCSEDVVGLRNIDVFHDAEEMCGFAEELGVSPGFEVFVELARRQAPSRIWTFVRADGTTLRVRKAVTELHDEQGRVTGYLGVAIDATEAVATSAALEEAEERWRVLMDHLPEATVMVLDADSRIQLVTGGGAMRQGVGDATGKLLSEVSSNGTVLAPRIAWALAGRESRVEVNATVTGAEHEIVLSPLPLADGAHEVLLLARDVSRERARERAVLRAKEQAERLFEDAPQGVALLDVEGRIVQINPALCDLFKRERNDLVGRQLASFATVPRDQTVADHLTSVTSGLSGRAETDWTLRNNDGDPVHVALSSTLLVDQQEQDLVLTNVVDVSERHRYEQQLAHLADHDPLTGLANRRRFDAELTRHLDHARRYGGGGAVLMLDLDHFKEVNDTLGHSAGDQLIVSMAQLLRQGMRTSDVVARLGGDEFAILLPVADQAAAAHVAETIVQRVREHIRTLDGVARRVTASVGVVLIGSGEESAGDLLAAADMMMYDAKDAGRDQYALLDRSVFDQPRSGARLQWTERIRKAIENDDFVLHLQPIMDLENHEVTGAEALLRLADQGHDEDDLVLPGRFLYIAERSDLIVDLDVWVVHQAVAMLADLQRRSPGFRLEVNVSGRSINDPRLEAAVVASLARHEVDPAGLVLEITETAAVADVEAARAFAERISALGCRFALDDFGAGFGSFYYLKHLLFDYVKIDGEFVASCHLNVTDRTILNSIVGIAHGLGKQTVAEFVAESDILDVIEVEGVDFAQGYHVGRPIPVVDFCETFGLAAPAVPA